eukprot:gb/GFBE01058142.1/.p1 GENE.gb/GFBE01058142.1/~~gb/GFBE01058142.1/.p1  ORF type:complete len:1389 (+),score=207.12 gb/GFBE01058142.1/:1-4167(+)
MDWLLSCVLFRALLLRVGSATVLPQDWELIAARDGASCTDDHFHAGDCALSTLQVSSNRALTGDRLGASARSSSPPDRRAHRCPRVYVYPLWQVPEGKFGKFWDIKQYADLASLARAEVEDIFGKKANDRYNVYASDVFSMAKVVLWRLANSKTCPLVDRPEKADLFVIPVFPEAKNQDVWFDVCKQVQPGELEAHLTHLNEQTAHRHVIFMGKGHTGGKYCPFWSQPEGLMQRVMRIAHSNRSPVASDLSFGPVEYLQLDDSLVETTASLWAPSSSYAFQNYPNLVSIPYVGSVHWSLGKGASPPWEHRPQPRQILMGFVGDVEQDSDYGRNVRAVIAASCDTLWKGDCAVVPWEGPTTLLNKLNMTFCLEPGGYTPYRRSLTDSVTFGCIPVIFSRYMQEANPWHWGTWENQSAVYIEESRVVSGEVELRDFLAAIPEQDVLRMQDTIAHYGHQWQFALDDFPGDAFDVLLKGAHRKSQENAPNAEGSLKWRASDNSQPTEGSLLQAAAELSDFDPTETIAGLTVQQDQRRLWEMYPCTDDVTWQTATCESFGWPRAKKRRRVIDGFCFNGEYDMLEARLRELAHVVNGTAVITTDVNFNGGSHTDTEVIVGDNIRHVTLAGAAFQACDKVIAEDKPKCRKSIAKNSIALAVEQFQPDVDDWILFSDVDEIPNSQTIRLLHECEIPIGESEERHVVHLSAISHFLYTTQCRVWDSPWVSWASYRTPVALKMETMWRFGLNTFQNSHDHFCFPEGPYGTCESHLTYSMHIPCAGWHLSSFGGLEAVARKRLDNADSYTKEDRDDILKLMRNCLESNMERDYPITRLPQPAMDFPSVPSSVAADPARFRGFFFTGRTGHVSQKEQLADPARFQSLFELRANMLPGLVAPASLLSTQTGGQPPELLTCRLFPNACEGSGKAGSRKSLAACRQMWQDGWFGPSSLIPAVLVCLVFGLWLEPQTESCMHGSVKGDSLFGNFILWWSDSPGFAKPIATFKAFVALVLISEILGLSTGSCVLSTADLVVSYNLVPDPETHRYMPTVVSVLLPKRGGVSLEFWSGTLHGAQWLMILSWLACLAMPTHKGRPTASVFAVFYRFGAIAFCYLALLHIVFTGNHGLIGEFHFILASTLAVGDLGNPRASSWLYKFLVLCVLIPSYLFAGISKLRYAGFVDQYEAHWLQFAVTTQSHRSNWKSLSDIVIAVPSLQKLASCGNMVVELVLPLLMLRYCFKHQAKLESGAIKACRVVQYSFFLGALALHVGVFLILGPNFVQNCILLLLACLSAPCCGHCATHALPDVSSYNRWDAARALYASVVWLAWFSVQIWSGVLHSLGKEHQPTDPFFPAPEMSMFCGGPPAVFVFSQLRQSFMLAVLLAIMVAAMWQVKVECSS